MKSILFALAFVLGMSDIGHAQYVSQQPACTVESTGLKYVEVEGSGFASMFFVVPLLALAPLAGTLDSTGQYGCHVAIIGGDAVGARAKIKNRPQVNPQ